jgi:DNA-binding transcriptional LysR family regulator
MLNVFVAVGETGGFAAAAHRMGLSPAAITRSIASLETLLGVELLQRTTRNVRLTEAGQLYLDDIRHIIDELDEANDAATGLLKGRLVVVAPESFGTSFVMPCIAGYLRRFPHVELVASFPDQVDELPQEGVHVALAIGKLRDPAVIATPVGRCAMCCALRPTTWSGTACRGIRSTCCTTP